MSFIGRGTAVRFRSVLAFCLAVAVAFGQQDYGAEEVWNKVKGKFGSKEGIKQNADVPLKTDAPMTNVEGTQSFDVRVQCPSKREGVRITFLPLAGNDYRLVVEQDLDLNGSYEYVYDTQSNGVIVSGVCSAGVVSCSGGGSWTNCAYYRWEADPQGYVFLVPTDDTSTLGGCFCSNSSCGVNSLDPAIVDYVAGGVSQAIMRVRNELGVSRSSFSASTMSVSLYVQDKTSCSYAGGTIYGEQNPTWYYLSQTVPSGTDYVVANPDVQSDPESPYYLVSRASEVQIEGQTLSYPSRVSCSIRKSVSVYTTDMYENCQDTWVDGNGEVWCVVDFFKDRGGSHCGGRTCRDCVPFYQGSNSWVVCGRWEETLQCVCNWICTCFWDLSTDEGISCSSEPCFTYLQTSYLKEDLWGSSYVFKAGDVIESICEQDECRNVYELLCRVPLQASVTLRMQQKWGIQIEISAIAGDKGRYWELVYRNDDKWERKFFSPGWTCSKKEYFRVLGVAQEEGETHVVGGIQTANGWGENHWYPPRSGHVRILKSQVYKGDVINLSETSTCPTDEGCVVRNEWICDHTGSSCIQTIRNGVNTGSPVLPSCYQTNTQIGTYTICAYGDRIEVKGNPDVYSRTFYGERMWFWVKREYECPPESVDIDLTRYRMVLSDPGTGYDPGTGQLSVADYRCEDGVCVYTDSYSAWLGTPDSCPVATCTVRTSEEDRSVFADTTNRSQTAGGSHIPVLEVRSCRKETGGWICPVTQGESVVEECRCESGLDGAGFSVSITTLQAVVDASRDIICSSVSP